MTKTMAELGFDELVENWFCERFPSPTQVQLDGWARIGRHEHTLIAAPTGSGKTLAAFLWALNTLVAEAQKGPIEERVHIIYVSPLKALGNDIQKNLDGPLAEMRQAAAARGIDLSEIRTAVRSGDTPAAERRKHLKRPPHILITTPESLYLLLTAEKSRQILAGARTIIVDEIHAIAQDKRGAHLSLTLERLDHLAEQPLQRIGLSATQKPIEEVAHLLIGARPDQKCAIVDAGHHRAMELSVEIPDFELGPIASGELQSAIYDRIAELAREHRTTILFVNTRRLVERAAHALSERLSDAEVAAHHGSLSRTTRLAAEQGLKEGRLRVVVATASLELGIDVGHVDLVCHLGAPRALATLLQRVGRSGHFLGATPKGVFFPLTRDDLLQCAAAVRAVEGGDLDRLVIPENPLDILAQQMVAAVASIDMTVAELRALVGRAWPFRRLPPKDFDAVLEMVSEGVSTRRGRRAAHLHYDRVGQMLHPRRGARLAAITSGGAIPDTADFDVVAEPENIFVGKVNEDFAVESLAGDIFQLGNHSWKIRRVEAGRIRVEDAGDQPPTIPFWLGESPGRTLELSAAVADLRREIAERRHEPIAAAAWLCEHCGVGTEGAAQLITYIDGTMAVLGAVPTLDTVIAERFFDEAGGMQLVLHTPFGARINRALGLSMRKRFCVSFDFELQAAATDDGVVLSLSEQHSFPLDTVFSFVHSQRFEEDLVQATLASPMFTNRWRWNATRALTLLRRQSGKKVPLQIQRMRAEDLMGAVFPEQLGCQDNRMGNIEPPDHPLVNETVSNCLHEAMDSDGLRRLLEGFENQTIRTIAVDTAAPSPMSHEILNANPWAFLDDAPLEERRARAVALRRTDPELASGIGALDPAAIAEVRRQAAADARDANELHDLLLCVGVLPTRAVEQHGRPQWHEFLRELSQEGRVTECFASPQAASSGDDSLGWVAAEREGLVRVLFPEAFFVPTLAALPPSSTPNIPSDADEAAVAILRGWMDLLGPVRAQELADLLQWPRSRVEIALARLESQGSILQGKFSSVGTTSEPDEVEWCERGLLARIHRLTLGKLRREIEPTSSADFMRFLFRWQHATENTRLHGRDGVRAVVQQLGGLELPGPAWESSVLPARVADYSADNLEQLCLAGEVSWGRLGLNATAPSGTPSDDTTSPGSTSTDGRATDTRRKKAPTRSAPLAFFLREDTEDLIRDRGQERVSVEQLSTVANETFEALNRFGASFLSDLAKRSNRLPTEVEDGLWELVAAGLVTGDGVAGLRTLLLPETKRKNARARRVAASPLRAIGLRGPRRLMPTGRWSLLRSMQDDSTAGNTDGNTDGKTDGKTDGSTAELVNRHFDAEAAHDARVAERLLARYGVVFREVCARERGLPPWRRILRAFRSMEARGEVRGGRFVHGFVGEQFALPHAVESLRAVRRDQSDDEIIMISAADPLNFVGILTVGARLSSQSNDVIAWRAGKVLEIGELGRVRSELARAAVRESEAAVSPSHRPQ
jgi:ATP-dependent Lhr-like helicase